MKFLWIFDQDAVWTLIPAVSALWALGGSGPKLFRRAGAPALVGLAALSCGFEMIPSVLSGVLLFAAAFLPYGDDVKEKTDSFHPLWLFFVGAAWAFCVFPIALVTHKYSQLPGGCLATGLIFSIGTLCSQKFNFPKWKFVEIVSGASIGTVAAVMISAGAQ